MLPVEIGYSVCKYPWHKISAFNSLCAHALSLQHGGVFPCSVASQHLVSRPIWNEQVWAAINGLDVYSTGARVYAKVFLAGARLA